MIFVPSHTLLLMDQNLRLTKKAYEKMDTLLTQLLKLILDKPDSIHDIFRFSPCYLDEEPSTLSYVNPLLVSMNLTNSLIDKAMNNITYDLLNSLPMNRIVKKKDIIQTIQQNENLYHVFYFTIL